MDEKLIVRREMERLIPKYDPNLEGYENLAEQAAINLRRDYVGGPLDDPDHWIWGLAEQIWEETFLKAV